MTNIICPNPNCGYRKAAIVGVALVLFSLITGCADRAEVPQPRLTRIVQPNDSTELLTGFVDVGKPLEQGVVVYIKVRGRWWGPKPTWDNPITRFDQSGAWACDIFTGGHDLRANEILIGVIKLPSRVPIMEGNSGLGFCPFPSSWDTLCRVTIENHNN
jgi:hypothetical protein